jgi:hypothetical protein
MLNQSTTNVSCKDSKIGASRVKRLVRATSTKPLAPTLAKLAAASLITGRRASARTTLAPLVGSKDRFLPSSAWPWRSGSSWPSRLVLLPPLTLFNHRASAKELRLHSWPSLQFPTRSLPNCPCGQACAVTELRCVRRSPTSQSVLATSTSGPSLS